MIVPILTLTLTLNLTLIKLIFAYYNYRALVVVTFGKLGLTCVMIVRGCDSLLSMVGDLRSRLVGASPYPGRSCGDLIAGVDVK